MELIFVEVDLSIVGKLLVLVCAMILLLLLMMVEGTLKGC